MATGEDSDAQPAGTVPSREHEQNVVSQKEWYRTAYQDMAATRFIAENPFADHFLDGVLKARSVASCLEIGAGAGILTEQLLQRGLKVVSVELAPEGVDAMRARFRREVEAGQLVPVCADALDYLEKTTDSFDLIIGAGVLHHITPETHPSLFRLACQRLTPGGQLAFGPEPCTDGLLYLYWRYFVPRIYNLMGLSYDWSVECGAISIRRKLLARRLSGAGFSESVVRPYQHFPVWRSGFLKRVCRWCLRSGLPWAVHVMVVARK